jgi:hypothetical protein
MRSGRQTRVVCGDAPVTDSVCKAWEDAAKRLKRDGVVDLVLLTVGKLLYIYLTSSPPQETTQVPGPFRSASMAHLSILMIFAHMPSLAP